MTIRLPALSRASLLLFPLAVLAAEQQTEHTWRLADGEAHPPATLEDVGLKLVKREDDALHFGTLSFYRRGDDRIDAYVLFEDGAELSERPIEYQRVRRP